MRDRSEDVSLPSRGRDFCDMSPVIAVHPLKVLHKGWHWPPATPASDWAKVTLSLFYKFPCSPESRLGFP